MLASPRLKFAANPHIAGKDDGKSLNLHQFARDGITLVGRLLDVRNGIAQLAPDLHQNLELADRFESAFVQQIDHYVAQHKLDVPPENLPQLDEGYRQPQTTELDLEKLGITTVIWATGYRYDFSLVKPPVFDRDGYPVQRRGVTAQPGLYFVGLPWLHNQKSGLLSGVGDDAAFIATAIAARATGCSTGRGHVVASYSTSD
ncbi:putative oxidoreductase CzcO [compost metagenome]